MNRVRLIRSSSVFLLVVAMIGCTNENEVFTLYRASPLDKFMRIHVATFDAVDGPKYNQENCNAALALFEAQPGVTVKYWCEKGAFKK